MPLAVHHRRGRQRLVLAERSTLSFWAAWLAPRAALREVHVPLPRDGAASWRGHVRDDPRYVYHDARRRRFFGRVRGDRIVWGETDPT